MHNSLHTFGTITALALAAASASAPHRVIAQEFSADVVRTPARGEQTSRLYVGSSKLKLQTLENGQPAGGAIWDFGTQSLTLLLDQQHAYIGGTTTSPISQVMAKSGAPPMWRMFRPSADADPCTTWNAVMQAYAARDSQPAGHATCRNLGSDAVNGRAAQKWAVTTTDRRGTTNNGTVWIDSRLHVVSRTQDSTGTMELRNIQEGAQPASVFAIPASYHQVDLQQMMAGMHLGSDSAIAAALGNAAKQVGNDAANSTADAAKTKASTSVSKKLKGILKLP